MQSQKRERLLELLKDLSVKRGQFTLASGKQSDLYIDSKQTSLHAEGATLIGECIFDHVQTLKKNIVAVGGITMGADPMVAAAAVISHQKGHPFHAFIIRKETKEYGTSQWVEGMRNLPHNAPVLIVEDVVTTGGSTQKAVVRAKESGLFPVAIWCLVDRLEGGGEKILHRLVYRLRRSLIATIFSANFLGICLGFWLFGCRPPPVNLNPPAQTYQPADYPKVLEKWTRSARIYQIFDTKLFVDATFHSSELRRAFSVAFPNIYGHGSIVTRRELVELTGDVEQYHTFFLRLYTANPRWNDLARPDSIWHLTLSRSDGSVSVDPSEIIAISIDANLSAVYPYLGHFDKAYLVRFPLTDPLQQLIISEDTPGFTLKIASALGEAKMLWSLENLKI